MRLEKRLQLSTVIGAGGKMGSGIALLLIREITALSLQPANRGQAFQLTLMDVSDDALEGLRGYLKKQGEKYAVKNMTTLKSLMPDAADDDAVVAKYVEQMMSLLRFTTSLKDVRGQHMIFEAILEKLALKVGVLGELKSANPEAFYFSNTSSIPIHELDERINLGGRIIGFHFYNPPAVQKLVELIIPKKIDPALPDLSRELGERLGKIIIPSNDVAGFIGNGHFVRDGLHGIHETERLMNTGLPFPKAIYAVNRISQDFLIRPMGIFQLIDYVGLEIFQSILKIMAPHFPKENMHSEMIDALVEGGIKGGQHSDGGQVDGFFQYQKGQPAGIWDRDTGAYAGFDEGSWKRETDEALGALPESHLPWKTLVKDAECKQKLRTYFSDLKDRNSAGSHLALNYMKRSREIGTQLMRDGVARSAEDVNGVLMNGFFHLYGPINNFV